MLQVSTIGVMNALKSCEEGEMCLVKSEEKIFKYNGNTWDEVELPKGNLELNCYDLNKSIIQQLPELSKSKKQKGLELIKEVSTEGDYFMLLGREVGYFTVYHKNGGSPELIEDAVLDCVENVGTVKSINWPDENARDAVEIWVEIQGNPTVLYFFNYDGGVIECAQ